jgi:hypothetical protein
MNKILCVTLLCIAAASAATKTKTATASASKQRGFGIGTHDYHPEVVSVGHGHGDHGWGASSHGGHGEYPALADIVALVLNLLVLAAFGGLVYLLLSPLLSDDGHGWGRSSSSPYYDAVKDGGLLSRVLNSIDYVDTTFAVLKISGDGCRKRIACEMERTAGRNKVFNYATGWFRKQMRSMDLYKDAVTAGDKQEDCTTMYPDCTYTLVDKVGKWVGN